MNDFKVGDVVQLKSGGPYMTVHDLGNYESSGGPTNGAHCIWFTNSVKDSAVFDVRVLTLVD